MQPVFAGQGRTRDQVVEIGDRALAIIAPGEQGGEDEQDQRHRRDQRADRDAEDREGEGSSKGARGHGEAVEVGLPGMFYRLHRAVGQRMGEIALDGEHHQSGHGADDDGVDKRAHHRKAALRGRIVGLGDGVGDRGRTLTRLVGEQAAGNTGADRDDDRCAEEAAARRLGVEGAAEDTAEGFRKVGDVDDESDQGHQQIGAGHPGDDRFSDPADRLDAADDDDEDGDRSHRAADPFLDAEQFVGAVTEAVGLDAVAGDQRGEERAEAEQDCQPGPFRAEADGDIAHRAAAIGAVSGLLAKAHGQRALGKGQRHAEQGSNPHPEDGAGAAQGDGGGYAG